MMAPQPEWGGADPPVWNLIGAVFSLHSFAHDAQLYWTICTVFLRRLGHWGGGRDGYGKAWVWRRDDASKAQATTRHLSHSLGPFPVAMWVCLACYQCRDFLLEGWQASGPRELPEVWVQISGLGTGLVCSEPHHHPHLT